GVVIVFSILGTISSRGTRTIANWAGLGAGILISVGLGLFRISQASDFAEVVTALALTLWEIGLVIVAEWVASGLRDRFQDWTARQTAHEQASAELDAAEAE